jgi:DNA-directed RNA polymerase specialized sigma24 family protein
MQPIHQLTAGKAGEWAMQLEIRGAERLSFRERQVVVLKETGVAADEIARRLGITAGTVATLYARAKAKGYQVVIVIAGDPLSLADAGEEDEA